MRKTILPLLPLLIISATAFPQAFEGKIEYDKKKQEAFVVEYNYPPEAVEDALIKKMEELGYKGREEKGLFNKDKGFRVYKAAYVTDITSGSMDYAFKIEPKRKGKEAVLYMVILGKDGANAKTMFESSAVDKAKSFLNRLEPLVEDAYLELQIMPRVIGAVVRKSLLEHRRRDRRELRPDLLDCRAVLHTTHRAEKPDIALVKPGTRAVRERLGTERHRHVERPSDLDAKERRRRDADDVDGVAVERQPPAER